MKINVIDISSKASGTTNLSDAIFGLEPRKDILHRTVVYQLAKKRAGTHKVKNRAEITATTKTSPRCPGVFGLYDFNAMSFYPLKPVVKSIF